MADKLGTSWIQNLNKKNLILVCKANGVEIDEADNYNNIREILRQYIKQEIGAGRSDHIKTFEEIEKSEEDTDEKIPENCNIKNKSVKKWKCQLI